MKWIIITYLFVGACIEGAYMGAEQTKCPGTSHPTPTERAIDTLSWLPEALGFMITYHGTKWDDLPCKP
jgi:hypothetical protein